MHVPCGVREKEVAKTQVLRVTAAAHSQTLNRGQTRNLTIFIPPRIGEVIDVPNLRSYITPAEHVPQSHGWGIFIYSAQNILDI